METVHGNLTEYVKTIPWKYYKGDVLRGYYTGMEAKNYNGYYVDASSENRMLFNTWVDTNGERNHKAFFTIK